MPSTTELAPKTTAHLLFSDDVAREGLVSETLAALVHGPGKLAAVTQYEHPHATLRDLELGRERLARLKESVRLQPALRAQEWEGDEDDQLFIADILVLGGFVSGYFRCRERSAGRWLKKRSADRN